MHPALQKYKARLTEIQAKMKANNDSMQSGIILVHLKKRDFNEMVQGGVMRISQFATIDYQGKGMNLGGYTGILKSSNEAVSASFENGSDCGNGNKKRTVVI